MTTIAINYNDIHTEVLRLSEYVAQKAKDYDGLRAIDEDEEQLRSWYIDGLAAVNIMLDRVIARKVTFNRITGEAELTFREVNNSMEFIVPAIQQYLQYHIIVGWLKLVAPALAPQYQADEQSRQMELMQLVYYREMPL